MQNCDDQTGEEVGAGTHQNHSLPKLGTENTPQWMKIPNLAWSYQSGRGLESIESQFGSYLARAEATNSTGSRTLAASQPILTTKATEGLGAEQRDKQNPNLMT